MLKRLTQRLALEARGLPLRMRDRLLASVPDEYKYQRGFIGMSASLHNLRRNGFRPALIFDIGAYRGDWSRMARTIYANVPICMVEADPERETVLSVASREIGQAEYRMALVGPRPAAAVLFHAMGAGSSVLPEKTELPRSTKQIPMTTLDALLSSNRLPGPYFLKLDVQGFELEVLQGAEHLLENTEIVSLEASLMDYNQGAPQFAEIIAFMRSQDFVVYDICGFNRRESDDALYMLDLLFVRETSALRARKRFWNSEAGFASATGFQSERAS